jgi:hypothetical protein
MARSPNRAVIEGNPRLIASSFLIVLHRSSSDPQSVQHPAVREFERDLLMQPHIHFPQSLVNKSSATDCVRTLACFSLWGGPNFLVFVVHRVVPAKLATRKCRRVRSRHQAGRPSTRRLVSRSPPGMQRASRPAETMEPLDHSSPIVGAFLLLVSQKLWKFFTLWAVVGSNEQIFGANEQVPGRWPSD